MTIILNAAYLGERHEAHEYLKKMFDFPAYCGHNLDALADCLGERKRVRVVFCGTEEAGDYFKRLLPVFERFCDPA